MALPKRLKPEQTTFLTIGNGMFPVSRLPTELVEEFAVLDKMRTDVAELTYRMEVLGLAIKVKSYELGNAVTTYLKNENQIKEDATPEASVTYDDSTKINSAE